MSSNINEVIQSLSASFPEDDGTNVELVAAAEQFIKDYEAYQRLESEAKLQKEIAKAALMALLGTHKTGTVKDWVVTWATFFKREYTVAATRQRRFSVRKLGS